MKKAIEFLKEHESSSPSRFVDNAKWRKENRVWLEWSRGIALSLIEYMESKEMNRNDLAKKLDVSPQYISKILSGKVNFSFKSVAELEEKLNIKLLRVLESA